MSEFKDITITNKELINIANAFNGYIEYVNTLDITQKDTQKEFILFIEEVHETIDSYTKKFSKSIERLNFKYGVKDKLNRLVLDSFGNYVHTEESLNQKMDAIEELEDLEIEITIPTLSKGVINVLPLQYKILFKPLFRENE